MASKLPGKKRLLDAKRKYGEMPVCKTQLNLARSEFETWRGSMKFAAALFLAAGAFPARWFPV